MFTRSLLIVFLALSLPSAYADTTCNDTCQNLLHESQVLTAQGNYQKALDKLKEASAVAPQSSLALSLIADLLEKVSKQVKPEQAEQYRKQAEGFAREALRHDPNNPVAQETLRLLAHDGPPVLHQPNAAARKAIDEAEIQFAQRHPEQALKKYQEAMQLDPQFSSAWVGAGDCYFMQKNWMQAEVQFRRATEIEPRNSQAWRFLSDALLMQGKQDAAEAALMSAIAADPSQQPNWSKFGMLRSRAGLPLKRLQLRRGYSVTFGADGKGVISLEATDEKDAATPDSAIRLMLASTEALARTPNTKQKLTPFEIELKAWQDAMVVADEIKANKGGSLTDPALMRMQVFHKDGQLEAAILLLLYKESYRPEFEKWAAAHPKGINGFVTQYGLQP